MSDVETRETVFHCARHPKVETVLRCSKCETPICPKCLVYTPVGSRCPDCGRAERNPLHEVTPEIALRTIGAGLGLTVASAIAWAIIFRIFFAGFFLFLIALGLGYGSGQAIRRVAKYRRSRLVSVVAGLTVVAGWILGLTLTGFLNGLPPALAAIWAITNSFDLFRLAAVALGVFMAVSRTRQ